MDEALFLGSNTLSGIAATAAAQSDSDADEHIVAAFFSVAWLEASLNELIHILLRPERLLDSPEYNRAAILARAASLDAHSASIELKLRVLCAASTDFPIDLGGPPWQHVKLLIDLRNAIVHLRPERVKVRPGLDDEPSSLVTDQNQANEVIKRLLAAGALKAYPAGHMVPLMTAVRRPSIGLWSYTTAHRALVRIADWFPSWRGQILSHHREPDSLAPAD